MVGSHTHLQHRSGVVGATSSSAARAGRQRGWTLLDLALGALILCFVWRVQDLFPVLAKLKFPLFATFYGFGWFIVSNGLPRLPRLLRHPVVALALGIFVLILLSVTTSLYPGLSFRFVTNDYLRTAALMLVMAAGARAFKDVERLLLIHLIGAAAFAYLTITRFQIGMDGRLGDLGYYDANDLGMLIVATLPMAVYLLRPRVRTPLRLFAAACLCLFMLTIVKTGSRGAFLGLIGVGTYMLFAFRAIPARLRFGAVAGAFALLMLFSGEQYWTMMRTLLHPTEDYNWSGKNQEGRMEIWKRGIGYMLQRPLTGVGAQAFEVAEGTISPDAAMQQYGKGIKWTAAHNSFVQIGAELGVGGLVMFVAMLVAAFRAMRRVEQEAVGPPEQHAASRALGQTFTASLIGYCIAGFFLSQAYAPYLYVLLGMMVALWKVTLPQGARPAARSASRRRAPVRRFSAPLAAPSPRRP